mgnify:CR=1 FL=1
MSSVEIRGVAPALLEPIDCLDRGAEPVTIDHGIMARGRLPLHPRPHGSLERDGRVRCDNARVVDPVEPELIPGRLIVVVPRELDGATAIVLLSRGTRGRGVAIRILLDLLDVLAT